MCVYICIYIYIYIYVCTSRLPRTQGRSLREKRGPHEPWGTERAVKPRSEHRLDVPLVSGAGWGTGPRFAGRLRVSSGWADRKGGPWNGHGFVKTAGSEIEREREMCVYMSLCIAR